MPTRLLLPPPPRDFQTFLWFCLGIRLHSRDLNGHSRRLIFTKFRQIFLSIYSHTRVYFGTLNPLVYLVKFSYRFLAIFYQKMIVQKLFNNSRILVCNLGLTKFHTSSYKFPQNQGSLQRPEIPTFWSTFLGRPQEAPIKASCCNCHITAGPHCT